MSHIGAIAFVISLSLVTAMCGERDTKLNTKGNNPPDFVISGSGTLEFLQVRGPNPQRDVPGPTASIYWQIKGRDPGRLKNVEKLSPITYGRVPPGYVQVYPEQGEAPPLVDGDRYSVLAYTNNANGAEKYFSIRDGKAIEVSK